MAWATLGLIPKFGGVWPDVEVIQTYRGRELCLRPEHADQAAMVSIEYEPPETLDEALEGLRRFLSAATWSSGCGFEECNAFGREVSKGAAGRPAGARSYSPPRNPKTVGFLRPPEPEERGALLALALFREAINERNPFYSFLGFFKIIETVASGRASIRRKIEDHMEMARRRALPYLERPIFLKSVGHDELCALLWGDRKNALPEYLYRYGRCAIAHAHDEPLRDPDCPADRAEIELLLPLIEAIGRVIIEKEHGVSRWSDADAVGS